MKINLIYCFTTFFAFSLSSFADVLLVPKPEVTATRYFSSCERTGYICTTDFFESEFKKSATPLFDHFIDHVDFSNAAFRDSVLEAVKRILAQEMLNLEQLALILDLLTQNEKYLSSESLKKQMQFKNELILIKKLIEQHRTSDKENFLLIFNERVPILLTSTLKHLKTKFPIVRINYASLPKTFSNSNLTHNLMQPILPEGCQSSKIEWPYRKMPWVALLSDNCNQDGLAKTESPEEIDSNTANSLAIIGLTALTVFVLNNYDISLSF